MGGGTHFTECHSSLIGVVTLSFLKVYIKRDGLVSVFTLRYCTFQKKKGSEYFSQVQVVLTKRSPAVVRLQLCRHLHQTMCDK